MCLFFEGMGNIVFHSPLDTCARIFWGGGRGDSPSARAQVEG
jgi:hypothetical protein